MPYHLCYNTTFTLGMYSVRTLHHLCYDIRYNIHNIYTQRQQKTGVRGDANRHIKHIREKGGTISSVTF
jgi:hypothetical protein